jgi:regulator of protease activity HflC (stomatin/prohibitin superfamily)
MSADAFVPGILGDTLKWSFRLLFGLVALLSVAWLVTGVARIPPDSQAVVTRFGQIVRQVGPGLLITWPSPVERVTVLPSAGRQVQFSPEALEMGGTLPPPGDEATTGYIVGDNARDNTWFFMTGDGGLVHLKVMVFYQIDDPAAYVVSSDHVEALLRRAVIAAAVNACASRDLDSILVARPERADLPAFAARRERFRSDLVALVNQRLQPSGEPGTGPGIRVARADVVASIPAGAKASFDNVLEVSQQVERNLAQARTMAEIRRQGAEQSKEQALDESRARSEETLHTAEGKTALVLALGKDRRMSHDTVLAQVYRERIKSLFDLAERVDTVPAAQKGHLLYSGAAP